MITEAEALRKVRTSGIRADYHRADEDHSLVESPPTVPSSTFPTTSVREYTDDDMMPDSDKNNNHDRLYLQHNHNHHHHHHHHHQEQQQQQQQQQQQHYNHRAERTRRRATSGGGGRRDLMDSNDHEENDDGDDSDCSHQDQLSSASALMAANTLANWSSPAPLSSGTGSDIDVLDGGGSGVGMSTATIDLSGRHHHLKRKDVFNVRKQREFIPDNKKDESYWDRRRRNNEAAKRSREKRRLNDMVLESRVFELTKENTYLRAQLMAIREKYGIVGENLVSAVEQLAVATNTAAAVAVADNQVALNLTKRAKLLSPLLANNSAMSSSSSPSSSAVALRSLVMASAMHHQQPQSPAISSGSGGSGRHHHDYWPVKSEDNHHQQQQQHHQHQVQQQQAYDVVDAQLHQRCAPRRLVAASDSDENNVQHRHLRQSPCPPISHSHDHALLRGHLQDGGSMYSTSRDNFRASPPIALTIDNGTAAAFQHYNGLHHHHHHHHHNGGVVAIAMDGNPSNGSVRDIECCSNESSAADDDRMTGGSIVDVVRSRRYSGAELAANGRTTLPTAATASAAIVVSNSVQQLHLPHKLRHKPRLSECSVTTPPTPPLIRRHQTPSPASGEDVSADDDDDDDEVDAPPSIRRRKYSVFGSAESGEVGVVAVVAASVSPMSPPTQTPPPPPPSSNLKVENSQLKLEMKRLAVEVANLKDMLLFNKNGASSNKSDTSSRDSGFATDGEPDREPETTST